MRRDASVPKRILPLHLYEPVTLLGVAPSCDVTKQTGLSLQRPDGSKFWLRLEAESADRLQAALQVDQARRTAAQSPMSSGSPSVDGSVLPGQSQ